MEWAVPANDTHTLRFTMVRVPVGGTNLRKTDPAPASVSQTGNRPYEDRQRTPGDFEALVSQRPIARHALEHLGMEDRGVTLYRREMRKAIRGIGRGEDPPGPLRWTGKPIPTYGGDTILNTPPAPTEEEDKELLLKLGRDMAKRYLKSPPNLQG